MRQSVASGDPAVRIQPVLLNGPPAIGKSAWARSLAQLIGVPCLRMDATAEPASFGVVGAQKGWGSAAPGRLLNLMLSQKIGNPLAVVDEIEKAGAPVSSGGQAFRLADALLPLLEPLSASGWTCPYFQLDFSMQWISWVLTANNRSRLPAPLLSRCQVIDLGHMTRTDLITFVQREATRRGLSSNSAGAICAALEWAFENCHHPSLRTAIRMLDRAGGMQDKPPLH